jgi:transcriptional regulator with XRE-family HTH domain
VDGQRLAQLRLRAGLTQDELADKTGLHQTAISSIERGDIASPRLSTMRALARGFDMTLAAFIAEVDPDVEPEPAEAAS